MVYIPGIPTMVYIPRYTTLYIRLPVYHPVYIPGMYTSRALMFVMECAVLTGGLRGVGIPLRKVRKREKRAETSQKEENHRGLP